MRDTGPLGKESGPSRASVESRDPSRQDPSEPNSCPASRRKRDPTPSSAHRGAGQGWRFGRSDRRCVRECQEGHGAGSPHAPPLSLEPAPARPRAPRPVRRSSRGDFAAEPPARPHGLRSIHSVCNTGPPSARRDGLFLLAVLGAILLGTRRGRKTGVLVLAFTLGFASGPPHGRSRGRAIVPGALCVAARRRGHREPVASLRPDTRPRGAGLLRP